MRIEIPGHTPSSKNSKQWTGKYLVHSKATQSYIKETKSDYIKNAEIFRELTSNKELPIKVGFHFVRKTAHKYDWVNPLQTVLDLMVKYEWIEDDNIDIIVPIPLKIKGNYTTVDPSNPKTIIKIYQ